MASIVVSPDNIVRTEDESYSATRRTGVCQQFLAGTYDKNNQRLYALNKFIWSISNTAEFTVDPAIGLVCHNKDVKVPPAGARTTVVTKVTGSGVGAKPRFS